MFSDEEFITRLLKALSELDNERMEYSFVVESGHTGKVRASGVGDCARSQYFDLVPDATYLDMHPETIWSTSLGHAGQAVMVEALRRMGYNLELPTDTFENDFMSGHVDGLISGLDLDKVYIWDSKLRNVFGYKKMLKGEFPRSDITMYLQMQTYIQFLGLEGALITMHPYDLSTTRNQLAWDKNLTQPYHVLATRLFIEKDERAIQLANDRAASIMAAVALEEVPQAEFDPANPADYKFPCGYCPWIDRCVMTGRTEYVVPPIPDEWKEA